MSITLTALHETATFAEIWPSASDFTTDYNSLVAGFGSNFNAPVKSANLNAIYYLLYARYGNTPMCNNDVNQFKMKIVANIVMYGPTWERKEEIQKSLRTIADDDLLIGAKQIYNHAYNPSTAPSTSALTELEYINDQNTASHKKSKMEAYSILWNLLHAEATREFIERFKNCFSVFVDRSWVPFYIDSDNEGE